jgi:precorrin-3B synthase
VAAAIGRQRADDACPGALRPHHAADGELVRIRVPGGALSLTALRGLAAAAEDLADGRIGLTSRGNLQVRGVQVGDVPALADRLRGAGLLPAPEHERVRNIVASPLSGRRPGSRDDVDPLVQDLDAALCTRPGLALLPGRFLFAVDDGSGDVQDQGADVLAVALGAGWFAVRPAGVARGVRVAVENVVAAMLAVAEGFLAERARQDSRAWRIGELAGGGGRLVEQLRGSGWPIEGRGATEGAVPGTALPETVLPGTVLPETGLPDAALPGAEVSAGPLEPGLVEQVDGRFAVCALAPLGLLTTDQAAALIAAAELSTVAELSTTAELSGGAELSGADEPSAGVEPSAGAAARGALRITPWRRVVIRDLELPAALAVRELLSSVSLVTEPGTAWSRLTACAGRPGCAKSLTDVHADTRAFAAVADPAGPVLHWAGCERGCGTPAGGSVVRLLATPAGYRIDGGRLSASDLAAAGLEPVGMEPAGIKPAGMEPAGIGPAGMEPAGMEPAGIRPTGIEVGA